MASETGKSFGKIPKKTRLEDLVETVEHLNGWEESLINETIANLTPEQRVEFEEAMKQGEN